MSAGRGPVDEAGQRLLVQRCKDLATSTFYDLVPTHWNPLGWMNDAMELAVYRHLQITPCERAVRVGQVVEHFADHGGDRMQATRYAIVRAALAP